VDVEDDRRQQQKERQRGDFTLTNPHTGGGFTVTGGNYTAQLLADSTATRNHRHAAIQFGFGGAPLMYVR
jgi:hypothetical protein